MKVNKGKFHSVYAMKEHEEVELYLFSFLTWASHNGDWSFSLDGRFIPGKESSVPITMMPGEPHM
jgi:hypothetical protein